MKKLPQFLTVLLTVVILCASVMPIFASAANGIDPRYVNTNNCTCSFIVSQGEAVAVVSYEARSSSFSYATVNVKIQKRFLGVFWSTVDEWTETCYDVNGYVENSTALEDTGTYRASFTVEIYGKDGSVDTIEDKLTDTYE